MLWFLKIFSPKNFATKSGRFLLQTKLTYKKWIITLVFNQNALFRWILGKIAKNCDHNIGPRQTFQRIRRTLPKM
jgi:hypothetical protein